MADSDLLQKRFIELANKADRGGFFTFTDFLGLAEISLFREVERQVRVKICEFGGAPDCERIMIRFGDEEEFGYSSDFPIVCIKIEPKSPKFADKLTHRDFLGAILNLGILRSTLGDIIIRDNIAFLFAKEDISEFIIDNLTRVKHTDVKLSIAEDLPTGELFKTEVRKIQCVGERIDAVIAKVFSISREDSLSLFKKKLVFVGGKICENNSYCPKDNEKISVRGYGRLIYHGYDSLTKKGKKNISVEVYV